MNVDRVIILADESANWKIGGLRQLERLSLVLDEFAKPNSAESKIDIFIFWRPDIAATERWQPRNSRITRCRFVERFEFVTGSECVFDTRLLVKRHGLEDLVRDSVLVGSRQSAASDLKRWQTLEKLCQETYRSKTGQSWRYVDEPCDIACCDRWLLRRSGKSRDGFVSRYLNRPVSRAVSRFLVKTSMTPNLWTLLITIFPLIGFLFLIRGDYFGFVVGAAFFNLHSILDGCDGEIARAKYLDSGKGPGLDALGDLISLLLFSLGLGIGLFGATVGIAAFSFLAEAVLAFLLIASRLGPHTVDLLRRGPAAVASSEHDESLRRSGGRIFGGKLTSLAFELTKRDVVFLVFLILAVLGLAQWTLHLLFIYAIATAIALQRGRAGRSPRSEPI